jgi:hypothetical protein
MFCDSGQVAAEPPTKAPTSKLKRTPPPRGGRTPRHELACVQRIQHQKHRKPSALTHYWRGEVGVTERAQDTPT